MGNRTQFPFLSNSVASNENYNLFELPSETAKDISAKEDNPSRAPELSVLLDA